MKFWVGVTDNRWFNFLRGKGLDEVNFWQPSARPMFTTIEPGTPFFFKLKKPLSRIGGYGTFVSFVRLPLSLAWETFGEKNGAASFAEFSTLIRSLSPRPDEANPEIGCNLIAQPVFFDQDRLLAPPADWASSIVRGKIYEDASQEGGRLIDVIKHHSAPDEVAAEERWQAGERVAEYSAPYLARARLGQGTFRALVTSAYGRKCAITGENILPVLEAAHIRPFSELGPSKMSNGLLLRSDFHKLFDLGYVTITPELRIEVSRKIREEWFNGKVYYRVHGQALASSPVDAWSRPNPEYLQWHNENRFQG